MEAVNQLENHSRSVHAGLHEQYDKVDDHIIKPYQTLDKRNMNHTYPGKLLGVLS